MDTIFGVPVAALVGQVVIGLINGAFYALMSLGLSIIFGLLHVVNFAHGAQYMMGAFVAWGLLEYLGLSYWWALVLAPLVVAVFGVLMERVFLRHLYHVWRCSWKAPSASSSASVASLTPTPWPVASIWGSPSCRCTACG